MISGSFFIRKISQIGTSICNYICGGSDKSNAKQILIKDTSKQPHTGNGKLNNRQVTICHDLSYIGCAAALGTVVTGSILKLSTPLIFTASTVMAGFFIISNLILKNRREAESPTNSYKEYKGVAFKSSITNCNKIEFTKGNPENTNTLIIKAQIPHKKGKQKTNFYCDINDGCNSKFTNISSINNTGTIAKKDKNLEDDLTQNCEDNYAQKINKNFTIKEENLDKNKIVPTRGKFYFKDIVISEPIKNSPTKIDSESTQNMAISRYL